MSWDNVIVGREQITLEATPARWHPDKFTPREAAGPTLAELWELIVTVGAHERPEHFELVVAPRVRRILRRRFLAFRKAWPRHRRFRRAVQRAYRKANGPQ